MSFDVTTLALAKSYADQHGGSGGGASTADGISYTNEHLVGTTNVKGALDALVPKSHTHSNKAILDKFSETDGKPTYDGKEIGGAGDFIIKMTIEDDGDGGYTVISCDATFEQVDAAVAAEKRVVLIATDTTSGNFWELPIIQALQGDSYYFGTCLMTGEFGSFIFSFVQIESGWQFSMERIDAGNIDYESVDFGNMSVGAALDMSLETLMRLYPNSHTHDNKDTLDKLSDANGKLQYNGSDVGLKPIYYIDLAGEYPNYTCPVAMDDITAAYNAGYNLVCRCQMGAYMAALPLFVPMPAANTWIFSGSGALESMSFSAQSFTIAIINNRVMAQNEGLMPFPIPNKLIITAGNISYQYDGSHSVDFAVQPATQLITATGGGDITLADNTEYRLTDVTPLNLSYPTGNFECWMRLTFAESGDITVTLPADTKYLGAIPNFKNGETWVLRFKDRVLTAQKVGDGDKDADGITPTIGENGNWYIGSTDTGKPSRGEKGDKGDMPVKGTDYWTAADKAEIVNDTLAALPTWTGGAY